MIDLIKNLIDWIQSKLSTKTGTMLIAFTLGLVAPMSYVFFQNQTMDDLHKKLESNASQIENYQKLLHEWQEKAFNQEESSMKKIKEVMNFMKDMEKDYNKKAVEQRVISRKLEQHIQVVDSLGKKLDSISDETDN